MSDDENKSGTHPAFTVDTEDETGSMPSVTLLLNRKKLGLSSAGPKPEVPKSESVDENEATRIEKLILPPARKSLPSANEFPTGAQISSSSAAPRDTGISVTAGSASKLIFERDEHPGPADELAPLAGPKLDSDIALKPPQPAPAAQAPALEVRPIAKRAERKRVTEKLIIWDPMVLKAGNDPLGKAIAASIEKGATGGVFLKIQAPAPGTSVPYFTSSAAILAEAKLVVWTGMKWDPTIAPEVWNQLLKTGFIEFPPPGTYTNLQSARNIARAAFGIEANEWLTMLRVGPPASCRGILALVSKKTISVHLIQLSPLFHANAKKAA